MKRDVSFIGEVLIRLSLPSGKKLETANQLDLFTGGSEANTACALQRLEITTAWVSRLPKNALGQRIAADLNTQGVDLSGVIWAENERAGIYFVEIAPPPGSTTVIYDRANSAMSRLTPDDLDWDFLLDARLLHLSGITPALSDSCHAAIKEAIAKAKERQVPISFDVNYRSRLWSPKLAAKTLKPLLADSTMVIMTISDAKTLWGLDGSAQEIVQKIHERFRPKVTALTLGDRGQLITDGQQFFQSPIYNATEIDRIGAGDAFDAGLIYGYLNNDLELGLKYGSAMSALKMGQHGDRLLATHQQIQALIEGHDPAIQR